MARGASKELRREIRHFLGRQIGFPPGTEGFPRYAEKPLTREAIEYLIDIDVLEPQPHLNLWITGDMTSSG